VRGRDDDEVVAESFVLFEGEVRGHGRSTEGVARPRPERAFRGAVPC
jgi:hypothetical protein